MASITIRNLDEALKSRLRVRAAQHGRSMEEEARDVLRVALAKEEPAAVNLVEAIRRRFAKVGPIELTLAPREPLRDPPDFGR
jgi:plasmid stability protein